MEATVTIKLTDQEAEDILATALAGGINYWADVMSSGRVNGVLMAHIRPTEGDDFEPQLIHTGTIQQGVDRLCEKYSARGHYCQDLLNDNVDAETADAVVQYAVLGKIIYG